MLDRTPNSKKNKSFFVDGGVAAGAILSAEVATYKGVAVSGGVRVAVAVVVTVGSLVVLTVKEVKLLVGAAAGMLLCVLVTAPDEITFIQTFDLTTRLIYIYLDQPDEIYKALYTSEQNEWITFSIAREKESRE